MNSFIAIQVRVLAAQAQRQLAGVQQQLAGFGSSTRDAAHGVDQFGSRMQWLGRQLSYNFTLPIVAAGAAASNWALENEKAMTRVAKVYGDGTQSAEVLRNELDALGEAFKALSNHFGVAQEEVIAMAADWAAAGASGIGLAKAVKLTLETMVLGEIDAKKATEALIAIQAQYGQSTAELADTISMLNMVENQTGISLAGLIDGFSRAAGVARAAGIDTRHLAAMLSALVPATGTAAQAGNALKTIISRLVAPTQEMVQVLGLMGINTNDMAWKSANAADKLQVLGKAFNGLDKAQQNVVSSVMASRFQVNKFEVLIRELTSSTGFYARALASTSDTTKVFVQMQRELNTVLSSNPKRLEIIWTMLKNAAADIIQPMIPLILALAAVIQNLVTWFSELNPGVQKLVLVLLLLMAAVGPIVTYIGAFRTLIAELTLFIGFLLKPFAAMVGWFKVLAGINVLGWLASVGGAFVAMSSGARTAGAAISRGLVFAFVNAVPFMLLAMARMRTIFIAFSVAIPVIAAEMWAALQRIWLYGTIALQRLMLALAVMTGVIWRSIVTGVIAGGPILLAAWTTVYRGVSLATMALAASLGQMWRAIVAIPITLAVAMGTGLRGLIPMFAAIGRALAIAFSGPWGWAVLAAVAAIAAFKDEIAKIFSNLVAWFRGNTDQIAGAFAPLVRLFESAKNLIIRAFNALPQGIQNALLAVVRTIRAGVMAAYDLLQYLNPWARHSPSLVDNVTTGVAEIKRQYQNLGDLGGIFAKAGFNIQTFGETIRRIQDISDDAQFDKMRKNLIEMGSGSVGEFSRLQSVLGPLRDRLNIIDQIMQRQERTVTALKIALDDANAAYDHQNNKLKALQATADKWQSLLDGARDRLQHFADAPIQGMKAMNDAIFANTMEQKRLQLQLLQMEKAVGPLDKLQSRLDAINGQMELLSGEQKTLRDKGAGSEILGQYDKMLAGLDNQKKAINEQIKPIVDLNKQIDELGRKANELDLQNALKFDPLKKQIDEVVNGMKEMPFNEIIAGAISAKADIDRYTNSLRQANDQIAAQQAVVDQAKAAADAIQATYDIENQKLQNLKDAYSSVQDAIQQVTGAMRALDQAARDSKAAKEHLTPGAKNFLAAEGGNFPDTGGTGGLGREMTDIADQSGLIDQFTKDLAAQTSKMFGLGSFLDPIKAAWNKAWGWVKENIGPMVTTVGDGIKASFAGIPNPFEGVTGDGFKGLWDSVKSFLEPIGDVIKKVFGPEVKAIIQNTWDALKSAFDKISPEIEKFKGLIEPAMEAIKNIWNMLKPILGLILVAVGAVLSGILRAIADGIGPFIRMIGDILAGVIRVLRGIIEFVVGVFTGDWKMVWEGVKDIFGGVWDVIWGIIKGVVETIWGLISGFVKGIWDFFKWLWDELVGHSIIPDLANGIIDWFMKMKDMVVQVMQWLWSGIKYVIDLIVAGWKWFWETATSIFNQIGKAVFNAIRDAWNGVANWLKDSWEWVKGKWNEFLAGLGYLYNTYLVPLWDKFKGGINSVKDVFHNAVEGMKNIWARLKDYAAEPVRFVIGTVINGGLVKGWNWISDKILGGKFRIPEVPGFATGGPVRGKGGPKSDSIWARLSNGEYVIPAKVVSKLGVGFFDWMIGKPSSKKPGDGSEGLAFADGGLVGDIWNAITNPGQALKNFLGGSMDRIPGSGPFKEMVKATAGSLLDKATDAVKGLIGNGDVRKAQSWLRAQNGKPYVWAAAGPNGYDCSGLVGAVWNIMHGRNPYSRVFSTHNQAKFFPKPGPGLFTAGWANTGERGGGSVGHTAANLAGLAFESRGGDGVVVGNRATPVSAFAHVGHYDNGGWMPPGFGGYYNGTRKPEAVLTDDQWGYIARMVESKTFGDPGRIVTGSFVYNEIHFHGDLEFPNVKSGTDAEEFIKNLEAMARGA